MTDWIGLAIIQRFVRTYNDLSRGLRRAEYGTHASREDRDRSRDRSCRRNESDPTRLHESSRFLPVPGDRDRHLTNPSARRTFIERTMRPS